MILLTFQKTTADGFLVTEAGRLINNLMQWLKGRKKMVVSVEYPLMRW